MPRQSVTVEVTFVNDQVGREFFVAPLEFTVPDRYTLLGSILTAVEQMLQVPAWKKVTGALDATNTRGTLRYHGWDIGEFTVRRMPARAASVGGA